MALCIYTSHLPSPLSDSSCCVSGFAVERTEAARVMHPSIGLPSVHQDAAGLGHERALADTAKSEFCSRHHQVAQYP